MAAFEKRRGAPKGNRNGAATRGKPRGPMLTRKLGTQICKRLASGLPFELACQAEGVAVNTAHEWVRRGEGTDERPSTPLMAWFASEKKKARARWAQSRLQEIVRDESWQSSAWALERIMPEHFGRPADRVEITGAGGGPITVKLAFDPTPIPAASRRELGGPVIDVEAVEET